MMNGVTLEKKDPSKQNQQLSQLQIHIKGESDFMAQVIDQRKQDINSIANIMQDINDIAKDIAIETKA